MSLTCVVQAQPHLRPSSYASLTKAFFGDNYTFADFVAAFLLFARDAHIGSEHEGAPETALNAFELLSSCYG